MINMFLHGCSDHRDQLFCLFELKKLPWPYKTLTEGLWSEILTTAELNRTQIMTLWLRKRAQLSSLLEDDERRRPKFQYDKDWCRIKLCSLQD